MPLHVGASVIVAKENSSNNLFGITEAIAESRATILGSNPPFLRQLVKHNDRIREQLDSIKTVICTGNKLSDSLRSAFREKYNLPILNYYGLTETTGICISQSPLDISIDIDSIGKPIQCIAQIVDEKGALLPVGREGELRIFSENLMQGYFKNPGLSQEVIREGWFYTNDIARFDEMGNIKLLGRKRNMIKTATEELIYIDEMQQFINQLEFIEEAIIYPYREEDTEKIAAFVVKKKQDLNNEAAKRRLLKVLREKLGEKKIPNQIHFLTQLPYTENGKLLTNKLLDAIR